MRSAHPEQFALADFAFQYPRTPRNSKTRPDLRGVLPIDQQGAVGTCTPLPLSFGACSINRRTPINDHALLAQGKLKRQGIRMRMTGQIIWANRCHVDKCHSIIALQPHIAAVLQVNEWIIDRWLRET